MRQYVGVGVVSLISCVELSARWDGTWMCTNGFKIESILFLPAIENSLGGLDRLCPMFSLLYAAYQSLLLTILEGKQVGTSNWQIRQKNINMKQWGVIGATVYWFLEVTLNLFFTVASSLNDSCTVHILEIKSLSVSLQSIALSVSLDKP